MHILVTGGAGFIGSSVVKYLLGKNIEITVIDNFDTFYNPEIKRKNIHDFFSNPLFHFYELDMHDLPTKKPFDTNFDIIIHLASKGGVRLSIKQKELYHQVNVEGTRKVFEYVVASKIPRVIFASSSSIYGNSKDLPWHENIHPLIPLSPYAKTKLLCEEMGSEYSQKYNFGFTSLRFFSVFGPKMRPDLAMYSFSEKILNKETIQLFGDGSSMRDYTYIDDIVEGIWQAILYKGNPNDTFNLGYGKAHSLMDMINTLERNLGIKANLEYISTIKEEAEQTWADNKKASDKLQFTPKTDFEPGIKSFTDWFISKDSN